MIVQRGTKSRKHQEDTVINEQSVFDNITSEIVHTESGNVKNEKQIE